MSVKTWSLAIEAQRPAAQSSPVARARETTGDIEKEDGSNGYQWTGLRENLEVKSMVKYLYISMVSCRCFL